MNVVMIKVLRVRTGSNITIIQCLYGFLGLSKIAGLLALLLKHVSHNQLLN